ncbi:MAG TPA: DUF3892 domain-containing protein [Candidatus Limnocylindria bacterium]|nr:DUF3892 domain-containing protein [Candidatus Limnocylindria bacterium]
MSDGLRIMCINRTARAEAHQRIRNVGGFDNGSRWCVSQAWAVAAMESRGYKFFVFVKGRAVRVITHTTPDGKKYLKTDLDGEQPETLLQLSECPA